MPTETKLICTEDLRGGYFAFSARLRASKAAKVAYTDWIDYASARLQRGEPVQEIWSYVIDAALHALINGEPVEYR